MGQRLRELSIDIRRRVIDILEVNAKFGLPNYTVCTSIEQYNQTYDFGRLNAKKVGVTNGTGTTKHPDMWIINSYGYAKEDGRTLIHKPKHISRECDERLQALRKEFPEIMAQIDKDLQSALGVTSVVPVEEQQKKKQEGRSKRK